MKKNLVIMASTLLAVGLIAGFVNNQGNTVRVEASQPIDFTIAKTIGEAYSYYGRYSVCFTDETEDMKFKFMVTGDDEMKSYGIVCGSFSLKANADALRQRLIDDGYKAVVVVNEAGKTYRVVCASFSTKEEAVDERNKFKARYPENQDFQGAWILYKK